MSVLETLTLVFTLDDKDLKKNADSAKKTIDGTAKSMENLSDVASTKVTQSLKSVGKELASVFVGFLAIRNLISNVKSATAYASSLGVLADSLNLNVESLDAWGQAVTKSGGTAEAFFETTKQLSTEISKFAVTGGSTIAPFFQLLGVRLLDANGKARDMFKILPELANAFQRVGKVRALELGKSIGLDVGTILTLQRGGKEVEALVKRQKELGVVTEKDTEVAWEFNAAWMDLQHSFRILYTSIGSAVLPALTSVVNGFQKFIGFLADHRHLVEGALIAIGTILSTIIIPRLIKAAIAAFALNAPFLIWIAIITAIGLAFALAYDDVMNFLAGNDSLIGSIFEKWPWVKDLIKGIIEVFKVLWDVATKVFEFIFTLVGKIIEEIGSFITTITKAVNAVKGFFGGKNKVEVQGELSDGELFQRAQQSLLTSATTPLNSQTSSSLSNSYAQTANNNTSNVSTGPITINTQSTDAKGIAEELPPALIRQFRQAGSSLDDGVAA